jgi:hypothetical protein
MSKLIRRYHEWTTVAVTALPPGWRNVYRMDDGTTHSWPAPALLLQECRATTQVYELSTADGPPQVHTSTSPAEEPYSTRVVYAEDHEGGYVGAAEDTANYAGTWPPGEPIPEALT